MQAATWTAVMEIASWRAKTATLLRIVHVRTDGRARAALTQYLCPPSVHSPTHHWRRSELVVMVVRLGKVQALTRCATQDRWRVVGGDAAPSTAAEHCDGPAPAAAG
jgi:hypothetical protein